MIRVQCVFGRAPSPADARTRFEIDESAWVEDLQDMLEKKYTQMAQQPTRMLWKLKEPTALEDIRNGVVDVRDPSDIAELMHPFQPLSSYGSWEPGKIHVVIITDRDPLEDSTELLIGTSVTSRKWYIDNDLPKESPSSAAIPTEFLKYQQHKRFPILCNRPPGAISPLPTTLLHPIFGRFLDLCENHQPTVQDNKLAMEISTIMSEIFVDEAIRAAAFRSILREYKIQVEDGSIGTSGRRRTDGHYRFHNFPLIIVEAKDEIGSGGAEPFFQAICYYGNFLQEKSRPWKQHSVLPCFHILLLGPSVAISSSVFTSKIHADVLGPVIPLFAHPTDNSMQELTARTFGALRIALNELEKYYETLPLTPDHQAHSFNPDCPYPNSYIDQSGGKCDFIYNESQPHSDRRIFFAKVQGVEEICVKFVKRYSQEAHRLCARKGRAPQLLGYELLAGGWKMVVMEVLDIFESRSGPAPPNSYHQFTYERDAAGRNSQPLRKAIENLVKDLHNEEYVHGDLRDKNFFVKNDAKRNFMLLDFDWGGKSGMVRYPMCINQQVRRPVDVIDGAEILPEHDREMVKFMFTLPPTGRN